MKILKHPFTAAVQHLPEIFFQGEDEEISIIFWRFTRLDGASSILDVSRYTWPLEESVEAAAAAKEIY